MVVPDNYLLDGLFFASLSLDGAEIALRGSSFFVFSWIPLRLRARLVNSLSILDLEGVGIGGKSGGARDDSERTSPRRDRLDKVSLPAPLEDLVMLRGEAGCIPVLIRLAKMPSLALEFGIANFGDFSAAFSALITVIKDGDEEG